LHAGKACRHFRMESLPFDGIRRHPASEISLFLDGEPVERCTRENGTTVVSRINRRSPFAFYKLGTRFPAGWFPSIPKQNVPSSRAEWRFLPCPNQRTIFQASNTAVLRPPHVGRTKPRVIC
jgi:hypothetical protein